MFTQIEWKYRNITFLLDRSTLPDYAFILSGFYKGVWVHVWSNDTTIWDYCTDENYPQKMKDARRTAYLLIKSEYESIY